MPMAGSREEQTDGSGTIERLKEEKRIRDQLRCTHALLKLPITSLKTALGKATIGKKLGNDERDCAIQGVEGLAVEPWSPVNRLGMLF